MASEVGTKRVDVLEDSGGSAPGSRGIGCRFHWEVKENEHGGLNAGFRNAYITGDF